tara:strand:+ start:1029 stop:1451 length:423 start_codon:yes stop_codon:yes gene_type:complete
MSAPGQELQGRERFLLRGGWVISALVILFLLVDAGMKIAGAAPSMEATTALGYPADLVRPLGIVLLLSTALYAFPPTAFVGAVLLTGYLGGAVASQLRLEQPLLSHVLFGVYFGILLWAGLVMRRPALRAVIRGKTSRDG